MRGNALFHKVLRMTTYQYQDYIELKKLFYSYLKEGVPMSQEVKQVYWEDLKRMERETRCRTQSGTRCMKKCSECDMCRAFRTAVQRSRGSGWIFICVRGLCRTALGYVELELTLRFAALRAARAA
mgnify:CR=1 FL=1